MEMSVSFFLISAFALLSRCCYGFVESSMPNDYMICKPVAGVFGTIARGGKNDTGILPVLQGPEGRPGSPGKTGLPGPKGEPDYTKVAKIVQEKLNHINARLYTAEQELKQLKSAGVTAPSGSGGGTPVPTQSPKEAKKQQECLTKYQTAMYYKNVCYKLIGGEGLLWNFPTAASNCTKLGGYLADLNSRAIYDILYSYIDETYSTVIQAWTGMRYENDRLLLRNGTQATYSKWSSGYPRKSSTSYYSSYKYVYIYIDTSASLEELRSSNGSLISFQKWIAYNPRKSSSSYSSYYRSFTYTFINIDTSSKIKGLENAQKSKRIPYAICQFAITGKTVTPKTTETVETTDASYYDDYYGDYD